MCAGIFTENLFCWKDTGCFLDSGTNMNYMFFLQIFLYNDTIERKTGGFIVKTGNLRRKIYTAVVLFGITAVFAGCGGKDNTYHIQSEDGNTVNITAASLPDGCVIKEFEENDENIYDIQILENEEPAVSFQASSAASVKKRMEYMTAGLSGNKETGNAKDSRDKNKDKGKGKDKDNGNDKDSSSIKEIKPEEFVSGDTVYSIVSDDSNGMSFHAVFAINEKTGAGLLGYSSAESDKIQEILRDVQIN